MVQISSLNKIPSRRCRNCNKWEDAAVTKRSSVLVARILLVLLGIVCAWAIEGWWWLLLMPAAPFFTGFVSSILSNEDDGE